MKKPVLILSFLLICSVASAELFVCQVDTTPNERNHIYKRQGDCLGLGLCTGTDNSGLDSNCVIADQTEYNLVGEFKKLDTGQSVGSRVINMTAQEQSDILSAEAAAAEATQCVSLSDLDITIKQAFINIFLPVYNGKVPAQYQITPAELKAQGEIFFGISCQ